MLSRRGWCLLILLGGVAPKLRAEGPDADVQSTQVAQAEPPADTAVMLALQARLARLRDATQREAAVRTAVEQADLALTRARSARTQGNQARALRAERLAEAATTLAERRLARLRELEATTLTIARREEAKAQVLAARESLDVAQKHAAEAP